MITIESFRTTDFEAIRGFAESIQEHERAHVPELKPGAEIGPEYTKMLVDHIVNRQGILLVARANDNAIGFVCAWPDSDDDSLLREEARQFAYISDIFVSEAWRRQGIAKLLLQAVESEMLQRGCKQVRICTKASNQEALMCYQGVGYNAYEIVLSKVLAP